MNFYERVCELQNELKAPKNQYNSFGKYKYRSCEDILEAVKPLCKKHKVLLTISDEIVVIDGRYYIKATASLRDYSTDSMIVNSALAREEDTKKGMDSSQITGTASSYARKYCLNGLFMIDDTKDLDTDECHKQTTNKSTSSKKSSEKAQGGSNRDKVMALASEKGISAVDLAKKYQLSKDTTEERFAEVLKEMECEA